jgi:hypothetical protein
VDPLYKFLVGQFTFLGFDFSKLDAHMLGAVAVYVVYLWKTGRG